MYLVLIPARPTAGGQRRRQRPAASPGRMPMPHRQRARGVGLRLLKDGRDLLSERLCQRGGGQQQNRAERKGAAGEHADGEQGRMARPWPGSALEGTSSAWAAAAAAQRRHGHMLTSAVLARWRVGPASNITCTLCSTLWRAANRFYIGALMQRGCKQSICSSTWCSAAVHVAGRLYLLHVQVLRLSHCRVQPRYFM